MPINNDNIDNEKESESLESAPLEPPAEAEKSENATEQTQNKAIGAKEVAAKVARSVWEYIKGAKVELIVLVALLALDLITKAVVAHNMRLSDSVQLIPNFLYITYVQNRRAAFGSAFGLEKHLSDNAIRIIFLIITVIAVGVFFYLMVRCRKRHILMRLAFALIISGALGNFYDRLVLHYVRDFVQIVFFGCDLPLLGKDFPVFNVADMALTVGVILFIVYFIVFYKDPSDQTKAAAEEETEEAEEEEKEETEEAEVAEETVAQEKRNEDGEAVSPSDGKDEP